MSQLTGEDRSSYVRDMFARIAGRYDLMNRLMTFGQDAGWRRIAIQKARLFPGARLLDAGTGTGDIAWEGMRQCPDLLAVGADFTMEMMQIGQGTPGKEEVRWIAADVLSLPFGEGTFDAVTSGYLLRNVSDPGRALGEQVRVVRRGGWVVVLESSPPKKNLLLPLIQFHLNVVIPFMGRLIAGDDEAYRYLPESTQAFQGPDSLAELMRGSGLVDISYEMLMFGTMAVHAGRKPE